MHISQCLITKNEEKNIEHCLGHLKSIVDEQIVVDTGSTDKTVEIAEKMGAKVFHFDWIDDFSAARNFTINKAKGDWIIFLDCDEYFTDSSIPLIEKCIKKSEEHKNIDGIMCELVNIDSNKNVLSTIKNISPRIFKNKSNIKYKNNIHEILIDENRPDFNYALIKSDATKYLKILHTGYDEKVIIEKNKTGRDIGILLKELEKDRENPQLNLYLSKSLYGNGEYEKSINYANLALDYIDKNHRYEIYCTIYSTILYAMLALCKPYNEMKKVFDEAVSGYPTYPDYYRVMGLAALRENNTACSIKYFEKCINYCNNYSTNVESVALGQIEDVYSNLLNAYIIDKNNSKVIEISVALLNADKYNYENLTVLIKTLLTSEKVENIVQFLSKIYNYSSFKDKIYLIKASEATENEMLRSFYESLLSDEELKALEENS